MFAAVKAWEYSLGLMPAKEILSRISRVFAERSDFGVSRTQESASVDTSAVILVSLPEGRAYALCSGQVYIHI